MKKNIPFVLSILFCLFLSTKIYSQAQFLSPGEKTGLVIDSLLQIKPVDYVQIKYKILDEGNDNTSSGPTSGDFYISGQFLVLKTGRSDVESYYNLDKVIHFYIRKKQLVVTLR